MESEERPQKIRKLSHDTGTASDTKLADNESSNLINGQSPENATVSSVLATTGEGESKPLSKNQIKKQRRRDEWEAKRNDRKIKRKEKVVRQRERKREERQALVAQGLPPPAPPKKPRSVTLPITILFDCNFDEYMLDGERVSLSAQITRAYSDNRNAQYRAHLAVASFGGTLKQRFDTVLEKHYESWKGTRFLEEDFVTVSKKAQEWMNDPKDGGKLVGPCFERYAENEETVAKCKAEGETIYLSSDSDTTLTELKPYTTYIIGGLVDKNREKGLCHSRAVEVGVKTARLPIGEFLDMASRKVLTTNHVNEIMLRWLECGDWGEAFMKVIPKRKGGQLKGQGGAEEDDEQEQDEAEQTHAEDDQKHNASEHSKAGDEANPVEDAKDDAQRLTEVA